MIYVSSDWHGYSLDAIETRLNAIGFGKDDRLYILGDIIDRGQDGLKILQFVMRNPNITLLRGNHEAMMLENAHLFEGESIPSAWDLVGAKRYRYGVWTSNGGYETINAAEPYMPVKIKYMLSFLEKTPLYKELEVNGKRYILTHCGLGGFSPDRALSDYSEHELVWERPELTTRYYGDGRIVVFGHTPTYFYGDDYKGKPIYTDTWYDIDVGASRGLPPLILRLDDMQEFYV